MAAGGHFGSPICGKTIRFFHYVLSMAMSADIYFRWEVMIIQHPDSYFRHIEVSEKIGLQKSPHRLMGGTGGTWTNVPVCPCIYMYALHVPVCPCRHMVCYMHLST